MQMPSETSRHYAKASRNNCGKTLAYLHKNPRRHGENMRTPEGDESMCDILKGLWRAAAECGHCFHGGKNQKLTKGSSIRTSQSEREMHTVIHGCENQVNH